MNKKLLIAVIFSLCLISLLSGNELKYYTGDRTKFSIESSSFIGYVPNEIIVKFKSSNLINQNKNLLEKGMIGIRSIDQLNKKFSATRIQVMFPNAKPTFFQGKAIDLSRYYKIKFSSDQKDIEAIVAAYQKLSEVEKAEPIGIHTVHATPNDSKFPEQWHLHQANDHDVDAPEAWDEQTGSENVIVGILDTGVRYFHRDLGGFDASYSTPTNVDGNMWINWAEKNGAVGVDDDGNGFVDDWIGWDFVDDAASFWHPIWPGEDGDEQDNDPRDFNGHGTHCAGNVGAMNNNDYATCASSGGWGDGIRQPWGNGVKVMPIRIGWSVKYYRREIEQGLIRMDFAAQAMYYAADNGAKIISCSWGSSNDGGLGDAIDYFLSKGGLIFKSAGNSNSSSGDYMATRTDIIAVAATDQNDCKADFSNYGSWVDISAPGTGIMSLYHNHEDAENDYVAIMDGTSMASPLAASVAALIWSQFPAYSASQVKQRLFDTADDIYGESCNASYNGKLGAGRINAYNAIHTGQPTPPAITINDVSVTEGDAGTVNATFTVTLSKTSDQQVEVDFATANGTATAGSDYMASSGTATFSPGTVTQPITVQVFGDELDENDETFFVNLTNAVNATIADNQGQGTILDDDELIIPSITINNVAVAEGDAGTVNAEFTVTLSEASDQEVTVDFATTNGTATAGVDYVAASGTLTFTPGTTTRPLVVIVNGDEVDEDDETFFVNLSNAVNATIADAQGQGTILDDDQVIIPSITINDVSVTEGNSGTVNATFTVTLSEASDQEVKVNFATANGTAVAGEDYIAASGTLTFSPGTLTQPITVQVYGDNIDENDETFFVNLSNPVNATIADNQGMGTILDDDVTEQVMHVNAIEVTKETWFKFYRGKARVQIVDANNQPVASATVYGEWSGGVSGTTNANTGSDGWATTYSSWRRGNADFQFCVTNVTRSGWTYDPDANVVTCGSTGGSTSATPISTAEVNFESLDITDKNIMQKLAFSYPNPFNLSTTINFYLPAEDHVTVEVYNLLGENIATLMDGKANAGLNSINWNGTDKLGHTLSTGTYFFKITLSNGQSLLRKMLLLK